jgi:serine protease Do
MQMGGEGSGVVYRPDGWIMTNDHVAGGFDKVTVVLDDGREFTGKVVRAPESDIALIKIEATNLPAVRFADSGNVRTGQFAIAFGSPFGLDKSMTVGHVSGLSRQSSIPDMRSGDVRTYGDLIQTDASINQGNSGGPLVNIDGDVVGINTAIYSETGGSVGIGFAIPANQAKLIADMLIEKGKVERGFLGILPEDLKGFQKKEWKVENGAVVAEAPNTGPASAAGIKQNDVVVRIGTYPVRNQGDVRNAMLRYGPGQSVPIEVIRDGQSKTLSVKLGTAPALPKMPQAPARQRRGQNPLEDPNNPDLPEIHKFFQDPRGGQDNQDVAPLRQGQAKLGVTVKDIDAATRKEQGIPARVSGAIVTDVEPGSVAARLGVQPGDIVEKLGDVSIKSAQDVSKAMKGVQWGQRRTIQLGRYSKDGTLSKTVQVTFR